jgi:small subunit ribosomal protein S16
LVFKKSEEKNLPVKLRLRRSGRKKLPFYRIVAIDSRKRRDGLYLEKIGYYNPLPNPAEVVIDKTIAMKWLDRGAIPSDTVKGLLQRKGIILEWDLKKQGMEAEKIDQEMQKWQALQIEREKRNEAKAAMMKREKAKEKPAEEPAVEPAPVQTETKADAPETVTQTE